MKIKNERSEFDTLEYRFWKYLPLVLIILTFLITWIGALLGILKD